MVSVVWAFGKVLGGAQGVSGRVLSALWRCRRCCGCSWEFGEVSSGILSTPPTKPSCFCQLWSSRKALAAKCGTQSKAVQRRYCYLRVATNFQPTNQVFRRTSSGTLKDL